MDKLAVRLKWAKLIKELTVHFTERYGHDEVSKWYFEVWNEPNLKGFFTGDMEEYFKLYEITSKAIKDVSDDYKVLNGIHHILKVTLCMIRIILQHIYCQK